MRAIILAGGKGTRLRPLTIYTPKPVVPVVNKPFLVYQLETLQRAGVSGATFSLSYQPDKIEGVLSLQPDIDLEISFVTEPSPLGTAGAYKLAANGEKGSVVVLNGDILTDLDLSKAIEFHRAKKASATLVLAKVEDASAYGLVEIESDSRIKNFLEKPRDTSVNAGSNLLINAGIYILEPEIAALIPTGENVSFEYKVFPELLAQKLPFYGFVPETMYWRDIGDPAGYLMANMDVLDGAIEPRTPLERSNGSDISTTASIDTLSAVNIECVIKSNVRIERSVLGTGVHIEERCLIMNSVIWPNSRIAGSAEIDGAIIGRGCHIGKNAIVRPGSVLGDKAVVPDYSVV